MFNANIFTAFCKDHMFVLIIECTSIYHNWKHLGKKWKKKKLFDDLWKSFLKFTSENSVNAIIWKETTVKASHNTRFLLNLFSRWKFPLFFFFFPIITFSLFEKWIFQQLQMDLWSTGQNSENFIQKWNVAKQYKDEIGTKNFRNEI